MEASGWRVWTARVAVLLVAAAGALVLSRLWEFANRDDPEVVERSEIARAAGTACARMRESVTAAAVPTTASVRRRVGAINAQNDAVVTMISTIQQVGAGVIESDEPTARWLEDWARLVTWRDAYATSLAGGHPRPVALPVVGGQPLVDRLNEVGVNCRVPLVLLAP